MRLLVMVLVGATAFGGIAAADKSVCYSLKSDLDFAACIDAELEGRTWEGARAPAAEPAAAKPTKPAAPAPQLPKPANPGKWQIGRETSSIDDSKTITLILVAESVVYDRYGDAARPRLVVRCLENETDVYIDWETFYFGHETELTTRLDKAKAETREWGRSTDGKAAFHTAPISFIRKLAVADSLVARTIPVNESAKETRFDLRGLRYHLPELQAACHWS
jgi:type VI secretion system protein VasI